ncbi:unnamed protein product [Zymoseptoria tritici ST99CH_3D1]|nr:unnamed protein product [Zymoseptoria tritici ST99CH_3D1]
MEDNDAIQDNSCGLEIWFKPPKTDGIETVSNKNNIKVAKHESEEARKWKLTAARKMAERRAAAALKFKTLLHGLPQELFDKIYETTMAFDIPNAHTIKIIKGFKLPNYLHITQELRDKSAREYFANNTFSFADLRICHRWVGALKLQHSLLLSELQHESYQKLRPGEQCGEQSIHQSWHPPD